MRCRTSTILAMPKSATCPCRHELRRRHDTRGHAHGERAERLHFGLRVSRLAARRSGQVCDARHTLAQKPWGRSPHVFSSTLPPARSPAYGMENEKWALESSPERVLQDVCRFLGCRCPSAFPRPATMPVDDGFEQEQGSQVCPSE